MKSDLDRHITGNYGEDQFRAARKAISQAELKQLKRLLVKYQNKMMDEDEHLVSVRLREVIAWVTEDIA